MGEVGVHLEHLLGPARERDLEAGEVGAPEALLARAVQDLAPARCSAASASAIWPVPSGEPSSTIRTWCSSPVAASSRQHRAHERADVLGLVVGGEHEPGAGHRGAYPSPAMRNGEIADAFEELASLYELDGAVVYRVVAYRNAAKAIREAACRSRSWRARAA